MNKFNLDRVDYPLEYLYFKFDEWDLHKKFLITNKANWTKYLTNFKSFISVDVLLCKSKEEMIRLIIWDTYIDWKEITPQDVGAVDKKHRIEFPYNYERFSQMYAKEKHPYNLLTRWYKNPDKVTCDMESLNQQVLKIELKLLESGLTEKLLAQEKSIINNLLHDDVLFSRNIYQNKFNPLKFDLYYYLNADESQFNDFKNKLVSKFHEMDSLVIEKHNDFDFLIRESIFYNCSE